MAGNTPSEPPGLTQASSQGTPMSRKRQLAKVYSPSAKEQFPDVPWYDLDYQLLTDMVHEMLDEIIDGQQRFAVTDSGIKGVIEAAKEAKNLPDLEKCCMAVLGEQGGRKLLENLETPGHARLFQPSSFTRKAPMMIPGRASRSFSRYAGNPTTNFLSLVPSITLTHFQQAPFFAPTLICNAFPNPPTTALTLSVPEVPSWV
jgi:hypothetical protein